MRPKTVDPITTFSVKLTCACNYPRFGVAIFLKTRQIIEFQSGLSLQRFFHAHFVDYNAWWWRYMCMYVQQFMNTWNKHTFLQYIYTPSTSLIHALTHPELDFFLAENLGQIQRVPGWVSGEQWDRGRHKVRPVRHPSCGLDPSTRLRYYSQDGRGMRRIRFQDRTIRPYPYHRTFDLFVFLVVGHNQSIVVQDKSQFSSWKIMLLHLHRY